MKVYKVELLIINFDEVSPEDVVQILENAHYPNHCISPDIKKIEEVDIGEWTDNHLLNRTDTCNQEYKKLFDDWTNIKTVYESV